ncbi:MAG: YihY/virulence factor BrkB family protein [Verrucomicrobiota bacterium]
MMKRAWKILKGTLAEFSEDRVLRLSAALAYYAAFSLGPILIIVIAVLGWFMEESTIRDALKTYIEAAVGPRAGQAVSSMLENQRESEGLIAAILSGVALLIGATGFFGQLQDSLNTIWEVHPKPGRGIMGVLYDRFLSFTMILGMAFLLLVSMVISTAMEAMRGMIESWLPFSATIAQVLHGVISFGVIATLFAMIFKLLPDARVRWRDVWIGAAGTAALFTLGKFALSFYLGRESTTSTFGAAGSLVLLLLWVYYSSIILFFGAEFTQVYAKETGTRIVPKENAEPVTAEGRAQQGLAPSESAVEPVAAPAPAMTRVRGGAGEPVHGTRPRLGWASLAAITGLLAGWTLHKRFARLFMRRSASQSLAGK